MSETNATAPTDVRSDLEAAYAALESRDDGKPERPERPERAEREALPPAPRKNDARTSSGEDQTENTEEQTADKLVPPEGDRPRDQFGRFLSKSPEAAVDPPKEEAAPAEEQTTDQPAPEAPAPARAPASDPPMGWSDAAKTEWARLPSAVQEAIQRRESEVNRGFEQRAQQLHQLEPIAQAIAPYAQKLTLRGVSTAAAVQQLLAVQDLLDRDPIEGVAYVARSYGVDLRSFAAALAQSQQPQDPQVQAVNSRIERMETFLRQQTEAQQQAELSRISTEIEQFRADTAAHPYFNEVRPAMAQLMAKDIAMSLQEAYEISCWAIPEIRTRLQAAQKRAEDTERARTEKEAAERARRAAVSVSSTPPTSRGAKGDEGKSIRSLLEANYDRLATS